MGKPEDPDLPPASDDDAVQDYLHTRWFGALNAAEEAMTSLRDIYPSMESHLPETATNLLRQALDAAENATTALHRAGQYVIGKAHYDDLLEEQTTRKLKKG